MIKIVDNCEKYIKDLFIIHRSVLPLADQMSEKVFFDEFSLDSRTYFVAIDDNDCPVGYIGLFDCDEDVNIIGIAVKQEWQRCGVGAMLIDRAIDYAKSKAKKSLSLEVDVNNTNAITFYRKHNFETISIRRHYYKDSDAEIMFLYL